MSYKIYNRIPNGYHNDLVLETVDQKPDIKTVLWFSVDKNEDLIPHTGNKDRIERARKGVLNTKFRQTQYELFKQYYNLTDTDDVPYRDLM
jgi:hypothetical protein